MSESRIDYLREVFFTDTDPQRRRRAFEMVLKLVDRRIEKHARKVWTDWKDAGRGAPAPFVPYPQSGIG